MSKIETLDATLGWLSIALSIAIAAIIVGLLFELPELFAKWKACVPHWVPQLGALLVLAGLGAELALHIWSDAVSDEVKVIQRAEIASQQRTIEQMLKPRRLSEAQKKRIAEAAAPFKLPFQLLTSPDSETWDFGMDIADALKAGGWDWRPVAGGMQPLDGRPAAGTTLADHTEIQVPPERAALAAALVDAIKVPGVLGMANVVPKVSPNVQIITIVAGTKR